jgi:predicted homoserine dehydrogenase-like protein
MHKPFHLIGLELGISVLSAALRGEPTGQTQRWIGDVAAVAKRDLGAGETLDGEGGYTVWGKLISAEQSAQQQALPIGLAHGITLTRNVPRGTMLTTDDVVLGDQPAVAIRQEMVSKKVYSGATPIQILEHVRKLRRQGKLEGLKKVRPRTK